MNKTKLNRTNTEVLMVSGKLGQEVEFTAVLNWASFPLDIGLQLEGGGGRSWRARWQQ